MSFSSLGQMIYPSAFPEKTRSWSHSPDKVSSSSADQESPTLPFDAQFNSSSAVYFQTTSPADTICDSNPSVETSCVSRPTMESTDTMWSPVARSYYTISSGSSGCHGRSSTPLIHDTMFPTSSGSPMPS